MTIGDQSRREVAQLHQFFIDWFNARLEDSDAVFRRVEQAFHRDFSMVLPSGSTIDRRSVLEQIRAAHGSADHERPIKIEVVDLATHVDGADGALVSYEERQFAGVVLQNRRISSAYFVPASDAPSGVQWRRLHETLLSAGLSAG